METLLADICDSKISTENIGKGSRPNVYYLFIIRSSAGFCKLFLFFFPAFRSWPIGEELNLLRVISIRYILITTYGEPYSGRWSAALTSVLLNIDFLWWNAKWWKRLAHLKETEEKRFLTINIIWLATHSELLLQQSTLAVFCVQSVLVKLQHLLYPNLNLFLDIQAL